jgi:predicted glycosyltransferase involved in capsule biosynthesis
MVQYCKKISSISKKYLGAFKNKLLFNLLLKLRCMENHNYLPFVSLCIPVKNADCFLDITLSNAILNNNYPVNKYEIIIGNHESSGDLDVIIQKYLNINPAIRKIFIPNTKPSRATVRNEMAKAAIGEIILFIDQDICISSDCVLNHVKLHTLFENAIVSGYTFGKKGIKAVEEIDLNQLDLLNISKSYSCLKSNNLLKDVRDEMNLWNSKNDYSLLDYSIAPFQYIWSCNLSLRRELLFKTGGFDEEYINWGIEDIDLAYSCQLQKCSLIISKEAWCFHIPHKVDTQLNYISWKKNLDYFFRKYSNRQIEIFNYFLWHYQSGIGLIHFSLDFFPDEATYSSLILKIKSKLPKRKGQRLGLFLPNEKSAYDLDVTISCNPFLPSENREYAKNECKFLSLLGIMLPFNDFSIDESVIIIDILILLNPIYQKLIIYEMQRVSKKQLFYLVEDYYKNDKYYNHVKLIESLKWICTTGDNELIFCNQ